MVSLFSRLKGKDGPMRARSKKNAALDPNATQQPPKPRWEDAWTRTSVDPEEVQELIRRCTEELKARALDLPFLLLPFRPTSDPSAVRTFIRHFFDGPQNLRGENLAQELRMTEPMVISGVIKWCWSRLQGGVVGWDSYELFRVGEQDSNMARDSFKTFIPLSVDSPARSAIIFDFFDLLSAIAAHGKMNGFGGRKLSRMAAWWAFEHKDTGNGFETGYKNWLSAADATSHLFFAYLRSLAPQPSLGGISLLPMSLQKLLQETEYPPQRPILMQSVTNKVVMIVDTVSPTPFALLRRAKHFQYRDDDRVLQAWSEYDDPVQALTEECRRVLRAISAANQSQAVSSSKHSTSLRDASWSRFEDIGFTSALEEDDDEDDGGKLLAAAAGRRAQGLRTTATSSNGLGRPTTPSWADFLSSGFVDEGPNSPSNLLLPPDKVLPPIETTVRQRSSQSHRPRLESDRQLEPGELASITRFDLDDAFWWVWMSSLAPEETAARKSAFGRCAVIETIIPTGRWLVMEEMVKGAAPEPEVGAYIAEKKGFFSWTRRGRGISRRKSTGKHALDKGGGDGALKSSSTTMGFSKTSIGPDQHAKILAAAAELQARERQQERQSAASASSQLRAPDRRGRADADVASEKTNSVLTLQPVIVNEASPALKWASKYDKEAIREAYLSNANAGRGVPTNPTQQTNGHTPGAATPAAATTTPSFEPGEEQRPEVPAKQPSYQSSPAPAAVPATSAPYWGQTEATPGPAVPASLTEKALEAPEDIHPAERSDAPPSLPPAESTSPVPPTKEEPESPEPRRARIVAPEPDLSPESKKQQQQQKKKLHKEKDKGGASIPASASQGSGFRKLFGRNKNRQSKLPEDAAGQLREMGVHDEQPAPQTTAPAPQPEELSAATAAAASHEEATFPPHLERSHSSAKKVSAATAPTAAPAASPSTPPPAARASEPVAEPLVDADSADALEAKREFSRFDQGPLLEQPGFAPQDTDSEDDDNNRVRRRSTDDDDDDAVPPPIARHPSRSPLPSPSQPQKKPVPASSRSTPPPIATAATGEAEVSKHAAAAVQDRWAKLRKNATDLATQQQRHSDERGGRTYSRTTDTDDNTSEETIETRVARIKARVAELTGNAESIRGPGSRTPPPIRR